MEADPWLSASDVAAELGVSRSTVWRMAVERLPYITTEGGQRRYRTSHVLALRGESTLAERVTSLEERVSRLEDQRRVAEQ